MKQKKERKMNSVEKDKQTKNVKMLVDVNDTETDKKLMK
jgi:hypothetical protein